MSLDPRDWEKEFKVALKTVGYYMILKAHKLSSGNWSYSKLAREGFPYAVRNNGPYPYGDPAIINKHTLDFYSSWVVKGPKTTTKDLNITLTNKSRHAKDLAEGIPNLTIPRPTIERIEPVAEYWLERATRKAIKEAFMK